MTEISKYDWKLFRERIANWQEHYMEDLLKQYIEMLSSPGNASDHFWELEERIKRDRKHPGVSIELNKSHAIWDIAFFVREGIIGIDELDGFSSELIDAVKEMVRR